MNTFQLILLDRLLAAEDYTKWRVRKVEQITPLNTTSYTSKLSFQFLFPRSLILDALKACRQETDCGPRKLSEVSVAPLEHTVDEVIANPPPRLGPIEAMLPVVIMPKRSLVGFSLWGPSGQPNPLISRKVGSEITLQMIGRRLKEKGLEEFFQEAKDLILAFCNVPGDELKRIHEQYSRNLAGCRDANCYKEFGQVFLTECISRHGIEWGRVRERWDDAAPILHRLLVALSTRVGMWVPGSRDPEIFGSPVTNPLIVASDYLRLRLASDATFSSRSAVERARIVDAELSLFFTIVVLYYTRLGGDTFEPDLFRWLFEMLQSFSRNYILMLSAQVYCDEELVIKFEQILPAREVHKLRLVGFLTTVRDGLLLRGRQDLPIVLGDAASTHFEVTCEAQDLVQDVDKTKLSVGNVNLPIGLVFGRVFHAAPNSQHLYSWISSEEIMNVTAESAQRTGKNLERPSRLFRSVGGILSVLYRAETTFRLAVWGLLFISFYLVVGNFSGLGGADQSRPLNPALIPIIVSLIGALARFRTTEPILAQWMRIPSSVILLLALGALLVVLLREPLSSAWSWIASLLHSAPATPEGSSEVHLE